MTTTEATEWRHSQTFGEKAEQTELTDADIVSAVAFDGSGDYLATGDKGGRIVVFKQSHAATKSSPKSGAGGGAHAPQYDYFTEFQSHDAEFDYLKSQEIEEKINQIKWCPSSAGALFLLSTNDKTIKLWKVHEKRSRRLAGLNGPRRAIRSSRELSVPRVQDMTTSIAATPRRVFANAHAYHVNSISLNSDGETFMSVDDLRINLWNLAITDASFNIVDIKPDNMEELTEVITAADFHPTDCATFAYSSSRGSIKIADMRAAALCDSHAKLFQEEEDPSAKSFFSEIIASISDVKFTPDGRYLVSRDYLTLKVWDLNMESRPIKTINIHDYLRSKLCELYENDCIFDKFEIATSGDGRQFVTGSYQNMFHIYDAFGTGDVFAEAPRQPKRSSSRTASSHGRRKRSDINVARMDFNKKALHVAWHPKQDTVAVAGLNKLFLYSKA